jgi:hypothetical protein
MMVITRPPAAEAVSRDSATEIRATLRFSHKSLTLADGAQPVELGDHYGIHSAAVHQDERTLQAGAVQVLG